ncbi:replication initiation protein RepC [Rhodoblastus acidophilus]|uniref:Replication initiation protein RepC n=1 Tax=Rhodoblastus acidophilus TaxID=1074 RepID=A0A212SF46_RHOAC|nr:plasmid replication protein RepC [Rhodoblastus acidophilus]PPQ34923.1 replication initiation protein RepC [Rhodoblastus acidophilus]RAI16632.1 replication initiation protein RepC [Rhodoblastus acidophilus]SNB84326.1 replication initiation protein RepC [Rhodoblastus acidophilus]
MEFVQHTPTTAFGGRSLKLAHVASQTAAKTRPPEKAVHKWTVFHAICAARPRLGLSERALTVLNALLSFHPETVLTGDGLVVFPSNKQLSLRAHGMASATLRRHLAMLVDVGLIVRRDSPNGKRYARKDRAGEIEVAFGFDLSPLVARADEFEALAEAVRAEGRALKRVRERISICRRDIGKMISTGLEEGVPTRAAGQGPTDWVAINEMFRALVLRLTRNATLAELEPLADELALLSSEVLNLLEIHVKSQNMSGNESQTEQHIQNSKPNLPIDLEPCLRKGRAADPGLIAKDGRTPQRAYDQDTNDAPTPNGAEPVKAYPLGMVLEACPDIADYAKNGINSWRDLIATAGVTRAALGVSADAWREAQETMGAADAAVVIAAILQKGEAIASPGGYLRALSAKARAKAFSIGPVLMALLRGQIGKGRRNVAS